VVFVAECREHTLEVRPTAARTKSDIYAECQSMNLCQGVFVDDVVNLGR
jgi:hypothetical protein